MRNEHIKTVRFLLDIKAPIDERAIALAARNGHIEIVKLLRELQSKIGHLQKYFFDNN
uniref:Ankyrin repeat protein n=1 Tax=Pithovirus LCDPAC01 TaxID=2506600 RepID=A0A481YN39_9VIRU|nr:MAG: hypothetical protein LCDPAC01_01890 [Pithovirus LCDPAC01]